MRFEVTLRDAFLEDDFFRDIEGLCVSKLGAPLFKCETGDYGQGEADSHLIPAGGLRGMHVRWLPEDVGIVIALDVLANLQDFRLAAVVMEYLGNYAPEAEWEGGELDARSTPKEWWEERAREWRERALEMVLKLARTGPLRMKWPRYALEFGPHELPRSAAELDAFEVLVAERFALCANAGMYGLERPEGKDGPMVLATLGSRPTIARKEATHVRLMETRYDTDPIPVGKALEALGGRLRDFGGVYYYDGTKFRDLPPEARAALDGYVEKPIAWIPDLGPEAREVIWHVLAAYCDSSEPDLSGVQDACLRSIAEQARQATPEVMKVLLSGTFTSREGTRAIADALGMEEDIPALVQCVAIVRREELAPLLEKVSPSVEKFKLGARFAGVVLREHFR